MNQRTRLGHVEPMASSRTASFAERPAPAAYVCPGESYAISRSVHLARLAAFDPRCRACPLRHDTGHLSTSVVDRLKDTERRLERPSLVAPEGLRGVYVNEITRSRAGRIAARFAETLWERRPMVAKRGGGTLGTPRSVPTVVVGRDERFSSPDVAIGVTAALRRMGCRVIDVHVATHPRFWFAVDHLDATAGVFVTGSGRPPAWTGLDFVGDDGVPVAEGELLEQLGREDRRHVGRPTRHGGGYRTFQVGIPYEAGLWKHFHALRPLRIACGSPSRLVRSTLETLFAKLPCDLHFVDVPQRVRNVADPGDADVDRVARGVAERRAHLGVLVDDDGQRTAFVDETGRLVPQSAVASLAIETLLADHPEAAFVVDRDLVMPAGRAPCAPSAGDVASMSRTMAGCEAVAGFSVDGRCWFREAFPTSDAILTLARMLAALSCSDAAFSERVAATTSSS